MAGFKHFWERTGGNGRQFLAVTDPGTSLQRLAEERGFRRVFLNDPEIGGRYSALSYFGIVPAALIGADIRALLEGAQVAEQMCRNTEVSQNSGLWLGCALGELALEGRDKLTFVIDPPVAAFGLWVEQLVAESLGKHGKGTVPVVDEPLGAPDAYGPDRVVVHLHDEDHPGAEQAMEKLARAGVPVITLSVGGARDLGRVMLFAEFATAVAGWALEINPFDQPDVQAAKDKTAAVLAMPERPAIDEASADALRELLAGSPPSYLAIQGFLAPDDAFDQAVTQLRELIRDRTKMATTFGYGPRYLHSTGQLHKGGPPVGRFLQLVHEAEADVGVPGESYTFGTLERAQADADLLVLRERGLPAVRVVLRGNPVDALIQLKESL
jgi:hypothetical protein